MSEIDKKLRRWAIGFALAIGFVALEFYLLSLGVAPASLFYCGFALPIIVTPVATYLLLSAADL